MAGRASPGARSISRRSGHRGDYSSDEEMKCLVREFESSVLYPGASNLIFWPADEFDHDFLEPAQVQLGMCSLRMQRPEVLLEAPVQVGVEVGRGVSAALPLVAGKVCGNGKTEH